jgi:translation elongation factor EF-1alpha
MSEKITISGQVISASERGAVTLWVRKMNKTTNSEIFKLYKVWFEAPTGAQKGDFIEVESNEWYEKETTYTALDGQEKAGRETHINEPILITLRGGIANLVANGSDITNGDGSEVDIAAPF